MAQDLGQLDAQVVGTASATSLTLTVKTERLQTWEIAQVAIECEAAPTGAACAMRKNGRLVSPMIPNMDVAGGDPPITIRPADELTVTWDGLVGGEQASLTYFYRLVNP